MLEVIMLKRLEFFSLVFIMPIVGFCFGYLFRDLRGGEEK